MKRDELLFQQFTGLTGLYWLDVGAGDGSVTEQMENRGFGRGTCIDLEAKGRVAKFGGRRLDYPPGSYDYVLFNFVLHHAAEHAEQLLKDALVIAKRGVLIQEDIDDGTERVRAAQKKHDPKAIYYSREGWHEMFDRLGGKSIKYFEFPEETLEDFPTYQTPRALMACR